METLGWLFIGGVVTVAGGAVAWLNRDVFLPKRAGPVNPVLEVTVARSRQLPPNHLQIMRYDALLESTGTAGLVREIQEKFGFADQNFRRDVVPVLQRFAEFVQLLPASESHHHAQPGGLLIHLLEVARNALHFRDALKLPQGASPEEQSRLGPRWTYGVFLAALLHDIGKPIADVRVTLYDNDPHRGRDWNGLAGSMLDATGVSYTVDFPETRDYGLHQKLPVILLRSMAPVSSLQWLAEDPKLFQLMMAYLSGDSKVNILGEIVGKADRESVAENLFHGPRTRFASARAVPVIERLMTALRRMLDEGGHLPLNRPGAAGYIHDECAWFVAGTVADRVRAYLNKSEVRRDGAAGLPEDNSKLFDVWQDYGAAVQNARGGSMWKIAVQIGEWRETFTVLCFPLSKLYRDRSAWPGNCAGTVSVVADAVLDASNAVPVAQPSAIRMANTASADDGGFEQFHRHPASDDTGQARPVSLESELLQRESLKDADAQTDASNEAPSEYLDDEDSAAVAMRLPASRLPLSTVRAPMAAAAKKPFAGGQDGKRQPSAAVERLMSWVQSGLADGSVIYNDSSAMVHFVDEGMLLLTPKIIQEFVKLFGPEGDGDTSGASDDKAWTKLQREFQKSGYPARNPEVRGSYIFAYATTNTQSTRPVNCYLIPQPERIINPVPPGNPYFVSKAAKLQAAAQS